MENDWSEIISLKIYVRNRHQWISIIKRVWIRLETVVFFVPNSNSSILSVLYVFSHMKTDVRISKYISHVHSIYRLWDKNVKVWTMRTVYRSVLGAWGPLGASTPTLNVHEMGCEVQKQRLFLVCTDTTSGNSSSSSLHFSRAGVQACECEKRYSFVYSPTNACEPLHTHTCASFKGRKIMI